MSHPAREEGLGKYIYSKLGGGIRGFITLPKVNIITRLEFELVYNDVAVQHNGDFYPYPTKGVF